MMLFLVKDIRTHRFEIPGGKRERTVPFLPRETRQAQFLENPT